MSPSTSLLALVPDPGLCYLPRATPAHARPAAGQGLACPALRWLPASARAWVRLCLTAAHSQGGRWGGCWVGPAQLETAHLHSPPDSKVSRVLLKLATVEYFYHGREQTLPSGPLPRGSCQPLTSPARHQGQD